MVTNIILTLTELRRLDLLSCRVLDLCGEIRHLGLHCATLQIRFEGTLHDAWTLLAALEKCRIVGIKFCKTVSSTKKLHKLQIARQITHSFEKCGLDAASVAGS
eukprot:Gregarina_sp_Poly_1__8805@NODE_528_length_7666_cov_26_468351_g418_i0_p10_GENE_NODE_528_length_7666_cov_26_468351_g418_i0NODE_528_length_7666_cov_26_468351_g418_i0_p10_ORF_typecomplete_len104_score6_32_NODE_528_length_7666_cov_26_468351_g418_i072427553